MISLDKMAIPDILKYKADIWKDRIIKDIQLGKKSSTYLKRRYTHPEIKSSLLAETSEKCAYCESKLTHIAFGHIEHIKPKSKFPELTFQWENLTLACELCNGNKSDFHEEEYTILNPYVDDISKNLIYLGALAYGLSEKGKLTVTKLSLNRVSLIERRREALDKLNNLVLLYNGLLDNNPVKEICLQEIEEQLGSDKEFSLVIKAAYESITTYTG